MRRDADDQEPRIAKVADCSQSAKQRKATQLHPEPARLRRWLSRPGDEVDTRHAEQKQRCRGDFHPNSAVCLGDPQNDHRQYKWILPRGRER